MREQFQVSLGAEADGVYLTVHDSGIGFDPDQEMKSRCLGLTSMKGTLEAGVWGAID